MNEVAKFRFNRRQVSTTETFPFPFPFPTHPKIKHDRSARPAVLPEVSLMIFASRPLGLNAHRRFIVSV